MKCNVYRAEIPESTCVCRQVELEKHRPNPDFTLGAPPYHRFGGCIGCETGLELLKKYKKGELKVSVPEKQKKCSKCGEVKSHSQFYNNSSAKDKLSFWCKECSKEAVSGKKKEKKAASNHVEKQEKANVDDISKALNLLFSEHQDLFDDIKEEAKKDFRPPAMQILYWLDHIVHHPNTIPTT